MAMAEGMIGGIKVFFEYSSYDLDTGEHWPEGQGYFLMAIDPGSGVINLDQWKERRYNLSAEMAEAVKEALCAGKDPFVMLSADSKVVEWLENLRPQLLPGDYSGPMVQVEFTMPESAPSAPKPGLKLPAGLNTKSLPELEAAFLKACAVAGADIDMGIVDGHIKLEDSLPWFEVTLPCSASAKKGKQFCQELAEAMNIRILFNRAEGGSKECTVMGVMDIDWEAARANPSAVVGALSADGGWAEFMEDYGEPVFPKSAAKVKASKSKKPKV